jgi:hypothetical protein
MPASRSSAILSLSGNAALGITGMIYAPRAILSLSGNAQLQSQVPMVVDELQLSGNQFDFETIVSHELGLVSRLGGV